MPHATLRLIPGVDTYKTQALLEAAVFSCNLIRYAPDPSGAGLIQKLGGWARFFPNAMPSIPREITTWSDLRTNKWLAVGCDISGTTNVSTLGAISNGNFFDITPHVLQDNPAVNVSTISGTNVVTILDAGATITSLDAVFIPTHISIAGVVIYGFYPTVAAGATTYTIALFDGEGNPVEANATVSNAGTVEDFTTSIGSPLVEVHLIAHGFEVGDTYPVAVTTAVGGVTLIGDYTVLTVIDADHFTISASNIATAATTVSINGGNARYNYWLAAPPAPGGLGYGAGGYGVGGYGSGIVPVGSLGVSVACQDWFLDNWGEILIAVPVGTTFGSPDNATVQGGPICYWSPEGAINNAQVIAEGPSINSGAFVAMPQRQIMAWGCDGGVAAVGIPDPLNIRWCSIENFFDWNATPINTAGSFRLTRGSLIVRGMQVAQQGLFWTDVGLWSSQFVGASGLGSSAIYSFNEIARGCGLIAPKAVGILSGVSYWMGQSQFFSASTSGVQPIECPVWDKIFQNLDKVNIRKIRCAANSNFGEMTWFFPSISGGSGENDFYVKLNTLIGGPQGWDFGFGAGPQGYVRSAWTDQGVLGPPIGGDGLSNVLFQHEVSNDADGQAMHPIFQTGYFVLDEADVIYFIDQLVPDMKWGLDNGTSLNAQVLFTFFVKSNFPDDPARSYGPFTLSQMVKFVTPRLRGRLVAMQIESVDVGTFWRIGANRFRYQNDGRFY